MRELPEKVKTALEDLKRVYGTYLEVRRLGNKYALYEATSKYDAEIGRARKIATYLGWITEEGLVVPARHKRQAESDNNRVQNEEEEAAGSEGKLGKYEDVILTNLSMNGRISRNKIAQRLGLKRTAAEYQIKKVEQKYGIEYLAEIDVNKLGYLEFIILIKFDGKIPEREEIKMVEKEPIVQFCATLKGEYDLMLYVLTENDFEHANNRIEDLRSTIFTRFSAKWYVKLAYSRYGYIPLREKFFDLVKMRVWNRTKENPRLRSGELLFRDYILLKELSLNGIEQFTVIDSKNALSRGNSQYAYYKLFEKGIIKRTTINMRDCAVKNNAMILMKRINMQKFGKTRANYRMNAIVDTDTPTNRYSVTIDIWDPDGGIRIAPLYKNQSVEMLIEELRNKTKGAEYSSLIISEILVGKICYRRFDNRYSRYYESLIKSGAIENSQYEDYS
ncbi:MAG: hypothetical protein KGH61_02990 [Candidatus Micrarchaeota archaeon]|nr:hypothetical protein [Candidatus Micrarchaeota archaeon]MDE1847889.1 hypothetical protein [Candidatus Micrarchaeota archaeon]MDE1864515.1 hypothetical protein [Candidatus Micrarchaeota archaeon]